MNESNRQRKMKCKREKYFGKVFKSAKGYKNCMRYLQIATKFLHLNWFNIFSLHILRG